MKRLFSLLVALLIACVTPALAAEIESVAGAWVLEGALVDGSFISAPQLGISMTYTLNEDGTIVNHLTAEGLDAQEQGVWVQDGYSVTITIDGNDPSPAQLQDKALAVYDKATGIVMRFVRTENQFIPGAVREDAAFSDFFGMWQSFAAIRDGMQSSVSPIQLVISNNAVVLIRASGGETTNTAMEPDYADGKITTVSDALASFTFTMVDNPALCMNLSGVDYYFSPIDSISAPSVVGLWHLHALRIGVRTVTEGKSTGTIDFLEDGSACYENVIDCSTFRRTFSWKQTGPLVTVYDSGNEAFDQVFFLVDGDIVTMVQDGLEWDYGKEALMGGTWYMDKGYNNQDDAIVCAEHGSFMTMELNPDGTFLIETPDPFVPIVYTGTWTQQGDKITVVTSDDLVQEFDISADRSTLMYNGDDVFSLTRKIPLAGEWYMNYMTVGDELVDPFVADPDMYATFTFGSDGTVQAVTHHDGMDESMTGTWTDDNSWLSVTWDTGKKMAVDIEKGELLITDPSEELVFHCTRTPLLYADRIGATLEDYQGEWQMTNVSGYGTLYAASDFSAQYSVVVSGNTAELIMVSETETKSFTADAAVESGKLLLTDSSSVMSLQLRGDGYALMPIGDTEIRFFRKIETSNNTEGVLP